jgi:hypothetical protein
VQTYLGRHNGFKPNDSGFVKLYHARVANLGGKSGQEATAAR